MDGLFGVERHLWSSTTTLDFFVIKRCQHQGIVNVHLNKAKILNLQRRYLSLSKRTLGTDELRSFYFNKSRAQFDRETLWKRMEKIIGPFFIGYLF